MKDYIESYTKYFIEDEEGASFIEYALIIAVIIGFIPLVLKIRSSLAGYFTTAEKELTDNKDNFFSQIKETDK